MCASSSAAGRKWMNSVGLPIGQSDIAELIELLLIFRALSGGC